MENDMIDRPDGCQCHMEVGDSPCPVHGDDEPLPRDPSRAPCPTCDGQGGWSDKHVAADNWRDGTFHAVGCPDCHGHGTLDAPALAAMVMEMGRRIESLRLASAANGERHGRVVYYAEQLAGALTDCVDAMDELLGDSDLNEWDQNSPEAVMARAVMLLASRAQDDREVESCE